MIIKKMLATAAAVSLTATPLPASVGSHAIVEPAEERVEGQGQLVSGFAAHWLIVAAVLGVLVFVVLDDDEEDPVSP